MLLARRSGFPKSRWPAAGEALLFASGRCSAGRKEPNVAPTSSRRMPFGPTKAVCWTGDQQPQDGNGPAGENWQRIRQWRSSSGTVRQRRLARHLTRATPSAIGFDAIQAAAEPRQSAMRIGLRKCCSNRQLDARWDGIALMWFVRLAVTSSAFASSADADTLSGAGPSHCGYFLVWAAVPVLARRPRGWNDGYASPPPGNADTIPRSASAPAARGGFGAVAPIVLLGNQRCCATTVAIAGRRPLNPLHHGLS